MDEIEIEEESPEKKESTLNDSENFTTAEKLRNSTFSSAFGEEIKKATPAGDAVDSVTAGIISQIAYAGTFIQSFKCAFTVAITAF